jgi:hypothetical protein
LTAPWDGRGITPMEYFTGAIGRVSDHPVSRLDELLPGAWHTIAKIMVEADLVWSAMGLNPGDEFVVGTDQRPTRIWRRTNVVEV